MKTIDTYQPKTLPTEETMIVHYGVDSQGKAHVLPYEKSLCSTCRPHDKNSYSFRVLKKNWRDTAETIIERNLKTT